MRTESILGFKLHEADRGIPANVPLCSNIAKLTAYCLNGGEMPIFEYDEKTFEQLRERIKLTIEALEKVDPTSMADLEAKELVMKTMRAGNFFFEDAQSYVSEYAITHFHFRLTAIYSALNHLGGSVDWMEYFKDVLVPAP